MRTLSLTQGSPEWHAHRATARNASDAPAVLGCSPYTSRADLMRERHTGLKPEVGAALQARFDAGHAIESAQRPGAEQVIGEPLYPVVGVATVDGLELSASYDGLTMGEDTAYECKTLNDELRLAMPYSGPDSHMPKHNDVSGMLPKHYRVQMEQQLAVCGGDRVLFVAATKDGSDVRRCWYYPDPALRAEIIAGWKQFEQDLSNYTPPAAAAVVVAAPVQALPAVSVTVTGSIAVVDNFDRFEKAFNDFVEHRLIREPKTDQDFADLDVQIKAMKGAEAGLDAGEANMLAQISPVDAAKKKKDMLSKLVRDYRLMAEKLLASEKERRRGEIVAGGIAAARQYIDGWNTRLGKPYMPTIPADFAGAVKGLKSVTSMEEKVAVELARVRAAADQMGATIQVNLSTLRELAGEHKTLFADAATLVLKAVDDCRAAVTARIAEHQAAEQKRLDAERDRIRQEEEAKARAKVEAEARQAATPAPTPAPATVAPPALSSQAAPAPVVVPMRPAAAPATAPTLKLGEIQARIAPLAITADGLERLGFKPAGNQGPAKLYHEADFPRMVDSMVAQLRTAQALQQQAAA